MNAVRKKRLLIMLGLVAALGLALTLALLALSQNINLFYTPTQIASGEAPNDTRIRAGGMVKNGSLKREAGSLSVRFIVTDYASDLAIEYQGILPDLFREGQGVVALGRINAKGVLVAEQILAKHDETYMPPEVSKALKESGRLPSGEAKP
ncbi:cytochrome c biogenesis protein CcmE [Ventosimonas gracilis]|uniref:Cytochrome c-type biogenesis protein CcmE n=1 Tax=Ventosimonas gracilis TaxID=1680762 RepID=A0A139SXZ7_9GAMM|nr:cytochrome c maturation protein CcmE [Ventosimonas gracilis]KXU39495.1 cytochrome c biogenesis protein CcmE [Ventosimonas gracilis]